MPKMRWILPLSSIFQANLGLNLRFHLRNPLMRIYLTAGVLIGMLAGCSSADQAPVAGKAAAAEGAGQAAAMQSSPARSEKRRVGTECVRTCRSLWALFTTQK